MHRAMTGAACTLAAALLAGTAAAQPADQTGPATSQSDSGSQTRNGNGYSTQNEANDGDRNGADNYGGENDKGQQADTDNGAQDESASDDGQDQQSDGMHNAQASAVSGTHMHKRGPSSPGVIGNFGYAVPPGHFYLTNDQQSEVADFSSNRDLSICVSRQAQINDAGARDAQPVPLDITWNGNRAKVYPGDCLYFNANKVKVRPAHNLAPGAALEGRIQTYGHYGS